MGKVQIWERPSGVEVGCYVAGGRRSKDNNLTPPTNPLGTLRCFVHPWRLGGPTVWGDDFPPLVVACPPAGRTIPHPWSSTTLLTKEKSKKEKESRGLFYFVCFEN